MAIELKVSTARNVAIGPFVDETDGKTAETGLTISQADIRISKNGGAFAQTNNATGATHMENGWYSVPLDTTDTGTLGEVTVAVHESGALPVHARFAIITANAWDSKYGTDVRQVDVTQWNGTNVTAPNTAGTPMVEVCRWNNAVVTNLPTNYTDLAISATTGRVSVGTIADDVITAAAIAANAIDAAAIADGAIDAGAIATGAFDADAVASDAVTKIADGIVATSGRKITLDTNGYVTIVPSQSRILDTGRAQGGGAATITLANTASNVNDYFRNADVYIYSGPGAGQVGTGIGYVGATRVLTMAKGWATQPTGDSYYAVVATNHPDLDDGTATYSATTDSLQAIKDGSATVDQVWGAAARTLTAATNITSDGAALQVHTDHKVLLAGTTHTSAVVPSVTTVTGNVNGNVTGSCGSVVGNVGGNVTGSCASVVGAVGSVTGAVGSCTGAVGSVTGNIGGNLVGNVNGTVAALASGAYDAIADATWNELRAGHTTAGTFGEGVTSVQGNVTGSTASIGDGGIIAATLAADTITAAKVAADVSAEIADQVWDELIAGHAGVGSTGEKLAAAASAGDPWTTALPGAYGAGTAGKIVGDNLNATVSSRAPEAGGNVASIKTKTDSLTFTTANKVDATIQAAADLVQAAADKVWATAARALTDKAGFSLAADQSAVTVGTCNALAANSITATVLQADCLTAAKVASDVSDEIAAKILVTPAQKVVTDANGYVTASSVQGNVTGSVASCTGNVGGNVVGSCASVVGAVGSCTGNVGGNVTGSVGSIAAGGITAASYAANSITATVVADDAIGSGELSAAACSKIADQIWDEVRSGHVTAGTFGEGVPTITTARMRKNASCNNFTFVMRDSTTHAPVTGKTITAQRSIDGGALAPCANSVTEISNGLYKINLAAADLNGSVITLRLTAATSDDLVITIFTFD